jgi:ligand-binding sensor domain-containing protein
MQDKSGKLWFATTIGVYVYDGKSFNFFKVTDDIKYCYAKLENLLEDNAGNIWFGGRCHDGVYRYDGKSITKFDLEKLYQDEPTPRERNWDFRKSFTRFTTKDGLLNNSIWSILKDKSGNLWVGTRETDMYLYDGKMFTKFSE